MIDARTPPRRALPRLAIALAAALVLTGCTVGTTPTPSPTVTGDAGPTSTPAPNGDLDADTAFTPLIASMVTTPRPVMGTDEKIHLAYEILLTNATGLPFELDGIEVRDADTQVSLNTVSGEELPNAVVRLGAAPGGDAGATSVLLGPAETWIAWMDVQLEPGQVPSAIQHRVTGALERPDSSIPVDAGVGTSAVDDRPAPVVGVPVQEGIWYMSEGCCTDDTHHRRGFAPVNGQGIVPQRFAIDFYMLDENGRTWEGDPSELTSYFTYRQPIIAATAGTVVKAMDGLPNSTSLPEPPPIPPIENTVGNHVVIEVEPGLYALYGHMDTGSVRVKVGDHIEQGQELGLIGSSGNSTTPHLHFHLQSTPTFFPSDGVPYEFDEFELIGKITERLWDDNLGLETDGQLPFEKSEPSQRQDQLPLDRTVIRVG
jgi:hypothetical protein